MTPAYRKGEIGKLFSWYKNKMTEWQSKYYAAKAREIDLDTQVRDLRHKVEWLQNSLEIYRKADSTSRERERDIRKKAFDDGFNLAKGESRHTIDRLGAANDAQARELQTWKNEYEKLNRQLDKSIDYEKNRREEFHQCEKELLALDKENQRLKKVLDIEVEDKRKSAKSNFMLRGELGACKDSNYKLNEDLNTLADTNLHLKAELLEADKEITRLKEELHRYSDVMKANWTLNGIRLANQAETIEELTSENSRLQRDVAIWKQLISDADKEIDALRSKVYKTGEGSNGKDIQ